MPKFKIKKTRKPPRHPFFTIGVRAGIRGALRGARSGVRTEKCNKCKQYYHYKLTQCPCGGH